MLQLLSKKKRVSNKILFFSLEFEYFTGRKDPALFKDHKLYSYAYPIQELVYIKNKFFDKL